MVYKPQSKQYELEFTDYPGLEVTAKSATLGELDHIAQLSPNMNEPDPVKRMEVFAFFEQKIVKWNVVHPETEGMVCSICGLAEDEAVPPTVKGMMCLEFELIVGMITGWVYAVAKVNDPKKKNLNNGAMNIPEDMMKKLEVLQNPQPLPTLSFS